METVDAVAVTVGAGVAGDCRGAVRPGKRPKRQVTLIEAESWRAALSEMGGDDEAALEWWHRRANLLVEGLRIPREKGVIVAIGADLRIALNGECEPCSRMDAVAPGLLAALMPDWRGGFIGTVIADGEICVGDDIRILT